MPTKDHTGTICAWAWSGLEIDAKGTTRLCCEFNDELKDSDGRVFNVREDSIDTIRNSQQVREIRRMMLSGQRPEPCGKCWQDQDAGRPGTLRHHANSIVDLDSNQLGINSRPIQYLGMALGTVCNLRCRICGPWASSSWAVDEIRRNGKENTHREQDLLKKGAWPLEVDVFWQDLENNLSDIKTINFYGGEPLMSPRHLAMLEKLSRSERSKKIQISYSTNGTIFPDKFVDIWPRFDRVYVRFSLDDIGARFNYQRKNADWDQVADVVNRFRGISSVECSITCTVSVFNALYLGEILTEFDRLWPDMDCHIKVLTLEKHNSILYTSSGFKQAMIAGFNQYQGSNSKTKQLLDYVSNVAQSQNTDESQWQDLRQDIINIDRFRNESLRDSHPELAVYLDL